MALCADSRRLASFCTLAALGMTLLTRMTQDRRPAAVNENDPSRPRLSPTALTLADAAKLLSAVGGIKVSEELLREDVGLGAPANDDGTLNLVYYAAWLVREVARGD